MRIEILDKAEQDLVNGFDFYEIQYQGLGHYFLDSVYADMESLQLYYGIHIAWPFWCSLKDYYMIKTVRKDLVQNQDLFRRASVARMSPTERVDMLIKARDIAFPYESLKKVVICRKLR
jgi:hypothetical protein